MTNLSIEKQNLIANHNLLFDLASNHNGYSIRLDSLEKLLKSIKSSSNFTVRSYFDYSFKSLINIKSLLILIIVLLFLEWFLRRRYINY